MELIGEDVKVIKVTDGVFSIGILERKYVVYDISGGGFLGYYSSRVCGTGYTKKKVKVDLSSPERVFLTKKNILVFVSHQNTVDLITKKMYKVTPDVIDGLKMSISKRESIILKND